MPSTQAWNRRGAEQFVQLHMELGSQDAGSAASSLLCLSLRSSAVKCSAMLSQALTSTRQGAGAARSSRSPSPHPAACHPPPGARGHPQVTPSYRHRAVLSQARRDRFASGTSPHIFNLAVPKQEPQSSFQPDGDCQSHVPNPTFP